jgi:DNA-binding response OmpR family regulator
MRHLLLVEDSVELAENLAEILRDADFETRVVHSAEQALSALDGAGFDGIISDLRLPRKTGVELLQNVRERGLDTPVILMSAFADEPAQTAARRLGALALLVKPFDCSRLLRLLSTLPEGCCGHGRPSPGQDAALLENAGLEGQYAAELRRVEVSPSTLVADEGS